MANRYQQFRNDIIEKIDFADLYAKLGLEIVDKNPGPTGWLSARSHTVFGGGDSSPSAGINVQTGLYRDFRADRTLSIFDFLVEIGRAESYKAAQKMLADEYDCKLPSISKNHPEHGVEWQEWNDNFAKTFCKRKPPITIEGLKKSGAMMCTRYDQPAFAWSMYDENLNVIGYYYLPRNGIEFSGEKPKPNVTKYFPEFDQGLFGRPAIEMLLSHRHPELQAKFQSDPRENLHEIFWCEGITDMVAGYSVLKGNRFISGGNGASQNITNTMVQILKNTPLQVFILGDKDKAGFAGSMKRSAQLREGFGRETKKSGLFYVSAYCPFNPRDPDSPESPEKGDLRDLLLMNISNIEDDAPPDDMRPPTLGGLPLYTIEDPDVMKVVSEEADANMAAAIQRIENRSSELLEELGIKLLMIQEDTRGYVFGCGKKIMTIRTLGNMKYAELLTLTGAKGGLLISSNDELMGLQKYTLEDVRHAMSLVASKLDDLNVRVLSEGIWQIDDIDNPRTKRIVAIKGGDFYFPNGEMHYVPGPQYGRYMTNYINQSNWFDKPLLDKYIVQAKEVGWRQEVHRHLLEDIIGTWCWAFEDMDMVCTGLAYASWLQTIWRWRPIVTVIGESESGKSWLMEFLDELFLGEGTSLAADTAAGMIQLIQSSARPITCDELDQAREQNKLFAQLRRTGRAQEYAKGTPSQVARKFKLNHIPWLSGIHHSAEKPADKNRLIELSLLKLDNWKDTIYRPPHEDANDLGHRVLACCLQFAEKARLDAVKLVGMGLRSRYRESYAVPFACLGAMTGISLEETNQMLEDYLRHHQDTELKQQDSSTDQEDALRLILSATVQLPYNAPVAQPTLGQMLVDSRIFFPYWDNMAPRGVEVKIDKKSTGSKKFVAMNITQMVSHGGLLYNTQWRDSGGALRQVLKRLKGSIAPEFKTVRVARQATWAFCFDLDNLIEWMGEDPTERGRRIVEPVGDDLFR